MDPITFLISICLAIGLAAACGFRVFIPPFLYGLFYRADLVTLNESWIWMGNDWIIILFGLASLLEISSTFLPWIDNILDIVATPSAIVAGTILASNCLDGIDPGLKWILSLICGIGVTGSFQVSTVVGRGLSSFFTGGLGNPIFALIEDINAIFISIIVILYPILGLLFVLIIAFIIRLSLKKLKNRKRMNTNL